MGNPINLGLRGLQVGLVVVTCSEGPLIILVPQFLWTLLILALTGNMIHEAKAGNPSIVNYVMFVAVFAILSLVYLTLASVKPSFAVSPLLLVLVDGLCTLFFLIGGIALAAKLGVHSCGNHVRLSSISTSILCSLRQLTSFPQGYVISNGVTDGSSKRCREAQASCVFLWFGFISFLGSLIFSALSARSGTSGGARSGPPPMSQA